MKRIHIGNGTSQEKPSSQKIKVLFLITSWGYGGAETQVKRIGKKMLQKDFEVVVVSMIDVLDEGFSEDFLKAGGRVLSLHMVKGKARIGDLIRYIELLKKEKPSIVHAHMFHANILSRAGHFFEPGIPVLNTIHGEEEYKNQNIKLYRYTSGWTNELVACGEELACQGEEKKIFPVDRKILVVPNGLDLSRYNFDPSVRREWRKKYNIDEEDFVWINVGRFSKVKNHQYLLEEFYTTLQQHPAMKLLLVGAGDEMESIQIQAFNLSIADKVIFAGLQKDVVPFYNMADAYVSSSDHEGLPLCLQEAASMGLPIIATDVGGCNEIVKEEENGYLCRAGENGALARLMIRMMELSQGQRYDMSLFSRKLAEEKYDLDLTVGQWIELYEKYINNK